MTESQAEYMGEASVSIEPGRTILERRNEKLYEVDKPAFVKISTGFKEELTAIPGKSLKIWLYITLSINRDTEEAFPGLRTIARDTGMSVNTVQKYLKPLVGLGLLSIRKREGTSNVYKIPEYVSANSDTVSKSDTADCATVSKKAGTVSKNQRTVSDRVILNQNNQNNHIKSPKNGDQESSFPQEYTYVEPGEEFEGITNKRKRPKWSEPKTEFEKRVMSAIHNKKHWQKHDRKSLTDLRVMEKSMTPLSSGREKYPTGWIEHVLEDWYLPENRKPSVNIPLKGFITACNNAEWKAKWISKNLEPAVPGVSDRTTTIEVEMPGSFG